MLKARGEIRNIRMYLLLHCGSFKMNTKAGNMLRVYTIEFPVSDFTNTDVENKGRAQAIHVGQNHHVPNVT